MFDRSLLIKKKYTWWAVKSLMCCTIQDTIITLSVRVWKKLKYARQIQSERQRQKQTVPANTTHTPSSGNPCPPAVARLYVSYLWPPNSCAPPPSPFDLLMLLLLLFLLLPYTYALVNSAMHPLPLRGRGWLDGWLPHLVWAQLELLKKQQPPTTTQNAPFPFVAIPFMACVAGIKNKFKKFCIYFVGLSLGKRDIF